MFSLPLHMGHGCFAVSKERIGYGGGEEKSETEEAMMKWENPEEFHSCSYRPLREDVCQMEEPRNGNGDAGVLFLKVMTDEQLETLRKQIAVYASICEQLVEMHKTLTSRQDPSGIRLGSLYCETLMASSGPKITSRQRWNPTTVQLQILERIFDQGNGTPSKQKIKEITSELSQHGQISETNVYNWFQNRRARSKRKQQTSAPVNAESEAETDNESPPNENETEQVDFQSKQSNSTSMADDLRFRISESGSDFPFLDGRSNKAEISFPSNGTVKNGRNSGQMSFYDGDDEHLIRKLELMENYSLYQQSEEYSMTG